MDHFLAWFESTCQPGGATGLNGIARVALACLLEAGQVGSGGAF